MKRVLFLIAHVLLAVPLLARPQPAALFGDHAVLQRDKPAPVWGEAEPGEKVTVRHGDVSASGVADTEGRWTVVLPPAPAGVAGDLIFEGSETVRSRDVVRGDVWLCSGQSNMAWTLGQSLGRGVGAEEIVAEPEDAMLRMFQREPVHVTFADSPQRDIGGRWVVASPQSRAQFSAVGYLFARGLEEKLKTPQGLIVSAVAGTFIESWMSDEALKASGFQDEVAAKWRQTLADFPAKDAAYREALQQWEARRKEAEEKPLTERRPSPPPGPGHQNTPSGCFNTLLNPLVPYGLRGVLWYQGEQNIGRREKYAILLRSFLADLRQRWGDRALPVTIVQVPNFASDGADRPEWAIFREAQAAVAGDPGNALVVTLDLGTPNDVHPPDKRELARRASLVAQKRIYDLPVHDTGPHLERAERSGREVKLTFACEALPLVLKAPTGAGKSFELAGEDGVFHEATAKLGGERTVLLDCPDVEDPRTVRYLWANAPAPILSDSEGLPAESFRSRVGLSAN